MRALVELALSELEDFEMRTFPPGNAAVTALAGFNPDLILLDQAMPVLDGEGSLHRLREMAATQDTPIVFITADDRSANVTRLKALGATAVIAKPIDPLNLGETIRTLWYQAE